MVLLVLLDTKQRSFQASKRTVSERGGILTNQELKKRDRYAEDYITISELPEKKRGCPLLLGEELETT